MFTAAREQGRFRGVVAPASLKALLHDVQGLDGSGFRGVVAPASLKVLYDPTPGVASMSFRGVVAPASLKVGPALDAAWWR